MFGDSRVPARRGIFLLIAGLQPQGWRRGPNRVGRHDGRNGRILSSLDGSDPLAVLSAPAYRLHPLKGDRRGQWSVRVSDNWRIVFRVEGERVFEVDLTDYH